MIARGGESGMDKHLDASWRKGGGLGERKVRLREARIPRRLAEDELNKRGGRTGAVSVARLQKLML